MNMKCLSDGCRDANTRTAHKFLKNLRYGRDPAKIYCTTRYSGSNVDVQLRFWVRTTKHAMERTNRSKLSFHCHCI